MHHDIANSGSIFEVGFVLGGRMVRFSDSLFLMITPPRRSSVDPQFFGLDSCVSGILRPK